ncbi:hypothetical protein [Blastococcus xanthinilyticus]|uniref:Uncharacterized protein n=1 Tax=Blastococcus xanthinilyticus TaxID=1564164 RepID=A0A5S5CP39_9ACTN|nr:hypothetical protein [Blastococcus xanthinilyticus]TYP82075.1 hypothetical protein BD833_12059 [Blastococcus xanthinilyticus]
MDAHPAEISDATPELDPDTFDLNAWIGGVTGTVRAVTLYQRSDLLAVIDGLQRELRLAELVADEDRGMNDASPDGIRQRIEETAREFEASGLVFKVEGRSDESRERIAKRLKKQNVTDAETVVLHQLADAVVEPKGITVDFLRRLQETSEPQLKMLLTAASLANFQPPKVDVNFSSGSSAGRRQRERS